MFLKRLRRLHHTLALRLTVWYASIFAASSILAFALVYVLLVSVLQERIDEDLQEDIEEFAQYMQLGGLDQVKTELIMETQGEQASKEYGRLWSPNGYQLMATDLSPWPGLNDPREILIQLKHSDQPILRTLSLPQREHNVRSVIGFIGSEVMLELGESLEDNEELLDNFLTGFLITLAAILLLGGPIGWFMARRALQPVEEVTQTATEIADGALNRRVVIRSQADELERLAQTFNKMLDRIQALIIGMREMTDNLAHDLRSPLGRIRASAEMSLAANPSGTETNLLAASTTEECDRLLEMINTTLDIAEAESGAAKLKFTDIDLVDLIRDACELFEPIAEDKQITIFIDLPENCCIRADRERLQRVVANLLDNALKYTPDCGHVTVELSDSDPQVKLFLKDTGIGIADDEQSRIFERFYRCDRSRSEHGNGLGLSLALAFARAHGGNITVSGNPEQGSTFTLILPRRHQGGYRFAHSFSLVNSTTTIVSS